MPSEDRKEYLLKYARENIKRIPLDVQKEHYEQIKAAAKSAGQPINTYIKQAINERMERESH